LKLQCDILLSTSTFKFNVRRYSKADAEAHAACTHSTEREVPQYCGITHGACDAEPDTRGPKGHRTTVPGTSEVAACQPCGHFMYYHLHDVAGMGKNSRFEIHHNADDFNALLENRDRNESASKSASAAAAPADVALAPRDDDDADADMFADEAREPDVVRFAASQFASCSVESNHFCADECNAAVQSALDTCVAWTNTLHVGAYAASTAAADAGGSARTSTRPTLNRPTESACPYEHSP